MVFYLVISLLGKREYFLRIVGNEFKLILDIWRVEVILLFFYFSEGIWGVDGEGSLEKFCFVVDLIGLFVY